MSAQILLRLVVAALLASIIGLERQLRQKAAGLRTHALVGLGSALIMIVSQMGFNAVISPGRIVLDPSRVAAQVVSGIGFLGAGMIIVRHEFVRGLTTAAGIWVCAAIGLACGSGLIAAAVVVTVLSLLLIYVYAWIEHTWMGKGSSQILLTIVCLDQPDVLENLKQRLTSQVPGTHLLGFKRARDLSGLITYRFQMPHRLSSLGELAPSLLELPGVIQAQTEVSEQEQESSKAGME